MKKIVITGGNGFIASLVKEALHDTMEIVSLTRKDLDLGDIEAVRKWFTEHAYDSIQAPWHRQLIVRIIPS